MANRGIDCVDGGKYLPTGPEGALEYWYPGALVSQPAPATAPFWAWALPPEREAFPGESLPDSRTDRILRMRDSRRVWA